jgi:hypothetical protein
MRTKFIEDLRNYLLALKDNNGKILFAHFELWNEQVQYAEEETAFNLPAVFLAFEPITWTQSTNTLQEAMVQITLHIVTDNPWHFGLADALHYAMARFSTEYSERPIRTGSVSDHNHLQLVDMREIYRVKIHDSSLSKAATMISIQPFIKK